MKLTVEYRRIGTIPESHATDAKTWVPCSECEGSAVDVDPDGQWEVGTSCGECGGAGGFFVVPVVDVEASSVPAAPRSMHVILYVSDWAYRQWFGRR